MCIAYTAIFAFLACVLTIGSTAPASSLEHDLKEAAVETKILVNKADVQSLIKLIEVIEANKILPEEDLPKWHAYAVQLKSWNVTIDDDYNKPQRSLLPVPGPEEYRKLDEYSNGAHSKIVSDLRKLTAQYYTAFQIKASNIINAAKESGYTNIILDSIFADFAVAEGDRRQIYFDILLSRLIKA
ncbi:uncharacterized protein LOC133834940 isoform X3 [Drosophila sulfurigaster albostrigata]|uniref:uncharacterized protein LOC133834940 isoform X3 n=1 Tax=Drosophila sulfurigaster albostrigata TaxID=89887 RepID=UPI002D21910B|nr:uncharacterized protein LOC133834940 isoform X3 [Drosophila sulfurigaster albostrigata]